MGAGGGLDELEYLALVTRLCKELENHLGVRERVLAEYLIDLNRKSPDYPAFKSKIEASGCSLSESFCKHLYEMIREGDPAQSSKDPLSLPNQQKVFEASLPSLPTAEVLSDKVKNSASQTSDFNKSYDRSREYNRDSSRDRYGERRYRDDRNRDDDRRDDKNSRGSRSEDRNSRDGRRDDRYSREGRRTEPRLSEQPISKRRRMTSQERFEINQLIASGVVSAADYPELADEDVNGAAEEEDQVEIELVDDDPAFLKGKYEGVSLDSMPKIARNPEGSLFRTAATSAAHLAELKESRKLTKKAAYENLPESAPSKPSSIREQRESLPIYGLREKLLETIRENQIVVVVGETGSGKTTQITQYLLESGMCGHRGVIGCTQPRRVAAVSVAQRVSEEQGCKLGGRVGYAIRFEDCTSPDTRIKYMTDGMLLRESLLDPRLSSYSVLMLDEAHERTVHTDVLFGLLKAAARDRPDLKLIVTSATLDSTKFSAYFRDAPVFTIPGRTFPVETVYEATPVMDYLDASVAKVLEIHTTEPPGDILLFLTGQDEIELVCDILQEQTFPKHLGKLLVLPVYSALPGDLQGRIFAPAPPGTRKVVVATNIAETSITIDGIRYVVDPGFCKQKTFNPRMRMDLLLVSPISQAQARQRAGRAGRTMPGKCFHLFTQDAYDRELLPTSIPEIQRTNLAITVLTLKALGINDLLGFDFMDAPSTASLLSAMSSLYTLGALDEDGFLTRLGRQMAEFPVDPPAAKMLLTSAALGCADQILSIVGMLSVQNIFYRPRDRQEPADRAHRRFHHPEGDHLTLLCLWDAWLESGRSVEWCRMNYVQARSLNRAADIKQQLARILERFGLDSRSRTSDTGAVRRALCSGLFMNAARRDPQEGYKTLSDGQLVALHPSSSLLKVRPAWVVYQELVMTSREYIREVTAVDPRWLAEAAPSYFRVVGPGQLSKRQLAEKIVPLHKPGEKPDEWRISRQRHQVRRPVGP